MSTLAHGSNLSQCGECRLYFKSVSAFDSHRTGKPASRRCLSEEELRAKGFEPNDKGFWRVPYDR